MDMLTTATSTDVRDGGADVAVIPVGSLTGDTASCGRLSRPVRRSWTSSSRVAMRVHNGG